MPLPDDDDYTQPKLTRDVLHQFEKETKVEVKDLIREYLKYCEGFSFDANELISERHTETDIDTTFEDFTSTRLV